MKRRQFIQQITALPFLSFASVPLLACSANREQAETRTANLETDTKYIFDGIMRHVSEHNWQTLPLGELMGKIGSLLIGTPYVGGTLEADGEEQCRINLGGLDCVTFFENVLCMSRIVKKGNTTFDDLLKEITFTRYRNGKLNGYGSRLHYTTEWIENNSKKGVVKNITQEIGGEIFDKKISFMSEHPKFYKPLQADPKLVEFIGETEKNLTSTVRYYIPKNSIKAIEVHLQTGDIIAISTSKDGLDYAHTGMIFKDENGVAHLLHASLAKKKVTLDDAVSAYLQTVTTHTGITVARPLEV